MNNKNVNDRWAPPSEKRLLQNKKYPQGSGCSHVGNHWTILIIMHHMVWHSF